MTSRLLLAATAAILSFAACSAAFAVAPQYQCAVGDTAQARDDVDVYDSPVKPRKKYKHYFIKEGRQAEVLARHEDGWCELKGVGPQGQDGWVAEDHLQKAGSGAGNAGSGSGGKGDDGGKGANAMPATLDQCKVIGPQEEAGGGSNDPKKQFACTARDNNGNKTCCSLTVPAGQAALDSCEAVGPQGDKGGGSNDPKKQFACTARDNDGNKTCCWMTITP